MSFSKRTTTVSLYNQPKVDDIVIEAIQLKGKGFSGSFTVGRQSPKSGNQVVSGTEDDSHYNCLQTLGDTLPLIITRLCEPKEASYVLIKKYLEQHFPQFNIEQRPDLLKSALQRAVDKGHLEQITGKGASGTFQLKKASDQPLLQGGELEEAILTAITAMNEPKTCSITTLRKFLLETHKDSKVYKLVGNLRRTLQRCKKMGWMEQITGNGLNGSYQLSYPYYPSPAVLFPDKNKEKEKSKRRRQEDSESDERDSEEEDSDEDEGPPPKKRKQQKRSPPKLPRPPRAKKSWQASRVKAKGKRPAPAKRPPASPKKPAARPKKPVAPAKKPAAKAASASKAAPAKSAPPAKKAPPTKSTAKEKADRSSKPKTLVAKKLTSKAPTRPAPKKAPSKKSTPKSAVQAKSAQRKSLRSKK
ncbi:hypothetical protein Z043_121018 [Scleropages formosus]|uniref:Heterochromatin protein 1-binding protein 3 n=1 Tax=Scleropages formosus TaxID=113540 RepID=A0A0P7TTI8_SCLFO|nr:hypothetical protein Z043_121018 [Scleropages formosus]